MVIPFQVEIVSPTRKWFAKLRVLSIPVGRPAAGAGLVNCTVEISPAHAAGRQNLEVIGNHRRISMRITTANQRSSARDTSQQRMTVDETMIKPTDKQCGDQSGLDPTNRDSQRFDRRL